MSTEGNFDDIVAGQFDDVEVPSLDLDACSEEELHAEMDAIRERGQEIVFEKMRRIARQGITQAANALELQIDGPSFYAGMIYGPCPDELYGQFLEQNRDFALSVGGALPELDAGE